MVSSATSIVLTEKGKLPGGAASIGLGQGPLKGSSSALASHVSVERLLRVPPFPGARVREFVTSAGANVDPAALSAKLLNLRVGGAYWAAQPDVPAARVVARSWDAAEAARRVFPASPIVVWDEREETARLADEMIVVTGECDPWHMLGGATALVTDAQDELCLVSALLNVPCYEFDAASEKLTAMSLDLPAMIDEIAAATFEDPFTGAALDALEAAELCGFWRRLVDSNRVISGGVGFAFWKQDHVEPLLWGGSGQFQFMRGADLPKTAQSVAVWRAKASAAVVAELEQTGCDLIEVEDGFLRSRGLGADCIPPLSITVDRLGPHFDPAQPSELELLLEAGEFEEALIDRARRLRAVIVEAGIGKYECGTAAIERPAGERRHILVPGQVEDDRAVQAGGCGLTSNLELLKRVREQAPDAYILYKPHPDVVAGHRRGAIADAACLRYADEIVGELPIASLIAMIDEVHVNTSLAGFEALLRQKQVTTYGVPFYAGWGLTTDLGPVPGRRTSRRTVDELIAAALLVYPRYLDPVTGLPCPAEVVVERLSAGQESSASLIVGMRRLQGKLMRRLRSLVQ